MIDRPTRPLRSGVSLRDVEETDLMIFFEHQQDPDANIMAAFTAKDPADQIAFNDHWAKVLSDDGILVKTILFEGNVAGHILTHGWFGEPEVSFWIGKGYWGWGIATEALRLFLDIQNLRPLYARAAKDNIASIRVLEKCGFTITGEDKGFANARGEEVEEYSLTLK